MRGGGGVLLALALPFVAMGCGRVGYDLAEPDGQVGRTDGGPMDGAPLDGADPDGATSPPEGGMDAGLDGGPVDAAVDGGLDAAGLDAGTDSGLDGGSDAGTSSGSVPADTYLRPFDPTPHGGDVEMVCGRAASGSLMYPLVRFDVSAHSGTTITQAILRLYQYDNSGSGTMTIRVHRVLQSWDEATADWEMADSTAAWTTGGGGNYDSTAVASISVPLGDHRYYEWDVTTLVQDWLSGTPNHGMQLTFAAVDPGTSARFASREHGTSSWAPALLITP